MIEVKITAAAPAEVKHLKEHYPKENEDRLRQYVAGLIINEKVWRFLENLSL
ncbi:MAG: hypothetical protein HYT48_03410 [Candidatus Vogelbacteria bacterium]|nr:hypothetical protein [Candidatus Vogelbacteria bacterium]